MTFNELYVLLKSTAIPQKRMKSNTVLSPPYMVVCEGNIQYGGADLKVLLQEQSPRIELYTTSSDFSSYGTLANILISNNIPFSVSDETQISDEGIFVRYFDLETQFIKL